MCTVVIHVPDTADEGVRLLAVRDEDPSRLWDPPGYWWPELPGVVGVRDRLAGVALASKNVDEAAATIINTISAAMTPEDLIALNGRSVKEELPAATIAKDWLSEKKLA